MRLIDADALEERAYDDLHYRAVIENWEFDVITNYLYTSPTIEAEPKIDAWISVKDKLPDSQDDVLVVAFWHECWQTMIGWYSYDVKKWRVITPHGEREPGGVAYWMPLPEPPT